MTEKKYLLLSIKPYYASAIREGRKTAELRKVRPKITQGDVIVIYESSPVMKITSYCEVDTIITLPISQLWPRISDCAYVSKEKYDKYYDSKQYGTCICLKNIVCLPKPISLHHISESLRAPQNYRYMSQDEFCLIISS